MNKEQASEDSEYSKWKQGKDKKLSETLDKQIKKMYEEFK
jgi:hypothetical protein